MPYGGSVIVRPVASEKSAHIEKFVMCQKASVPSKTSRRRGSARKRRPAVAKLPDKNYVVVDCSSRLDTLPRSSSSSQPFIPDTRHSESSGSRSSTTPEMYNCVEDFAVTVDQTTYDNVKNIDSIGRRVFMKNGIEKTIDDLDTDIGFLTVKPPNCPATPNNNVHGLNIFSSDCSKLWASGVTSPIGSEHTYNSVQVIKILLLLILNIQFI